MKSDTIFTLVVYAPLYATVMMGTALLSACAAPETFVAESPRQAQHAVIGQEKQLMIKFTDALSEPQIRQRLVEMGAAYQVSFRLLRPMSGGAYVISVQGTSDAQRLSQLLAQIGKRPDIVYIEQDKRMHHFQQKSSVPIY